MTRGKATKIGTAAKVPHLNVLISPEKKVRVKSETKKEIRNEIIKMLKKNEMKK